jgi:acetyltransferase
VSLDAFFAPRSVAVIGASADPSSVGYAVARNLLYGCAGSEDRGAGFDGPIHLVNPKGGELLGQRVHESLRRVAEPVDLLIVAVPAKAVVSVLEEAAEVRARAAIVMSAGFAEMGEEGRALKEELAKTARAAGIRVIGPNCLGVMRPASKLNASFSADATPDGHIALLSQSGALITGLLTYAHRERFGFSASVSIGEKADVTDEEVLDWLAADERTRLIAHYVESFDDPRAVFEALRRTSARTPVVAIKGGSSAAGAHAASSHTGALAGSSGAYRAAFAQAGVLEARTIGDFVAWSRALAFQSPAPGDRIAVLTNAGGPGVLAADAIARAGLRVAELSDATRAALDEALPPVWSRGNPVDVIGDAGPERYVAALDALGRAPEVDGIVVILTVQAMTSPREVACALVEAHREGEWDKPVLSSFLGMIGTEAAECLDAYGIPEYDVPERAVGAMGALVRRGRWLRRRPVEPTRFAHLPTPDLPGARRAIEPLRASGRRHLDLEQARRILRLAGIPYGATAAAADAEEAVEQAESIGYPVVVKVRSRDVVHKREAGGVVLNVIDADHVRRACALIRERLAERAPDAVLEGFVVEEQVEGAELVIGAFHDPGFGPIVMAGVGGSLVEVLEDVAFRLVPLERLDALEMLDELRTQGLLDGARGAPAVDRRELAELVVRLSDLMEAAPEIAEIDVNPLMITDRGLVATDARVILGEGRSAH